MSTTTTTICFQDILKTALQQKSSSSSPNDHDDHDEQNEDPSMTIANACFELANAKVITYRLYSDEENEDEDNNDRGDTAITAADEEDTNKDEAAATLLKRKKRKRKRKRHETQCKPCIYIRQDMEQACGQHTGGIVWETSYLLLSYLLSLRGGRKEDDTTSTSSGNSKKKYPCGRRVLEVGAGCGLLGLGIYHAQLAQHVILTETESVLPNLQYNVSQNNDDDDDDETDTPDDKKSSKSRRRTQPKGRRSLQVASLDWTRYQKDCQESQILPHSMDFIVGTDVVFSTRLVGPLLETLRYLSHETTTILLCLQERCPDAHQLLLSSCSNGNHHSYGLSLQDITKQVTTEVPACQWGKDLDCCILKLQVIPSPTTKKSNKKS